MSSCCDSSSCMNSSWLADARARWRWHLLWERALFTMLASCTLVTTIPDKSTEAWHARAVGLGCVSTAAAGSCRAARGGFTQFCDLAQSSCPSLIPHRNRDPAFACAPRCLFELASPGAFRSLVVSVHAPSGL